MTALQFDSQYGGNPPQNYERFFVPAIGTPFAEDIIRTAALRESERVLDVACGTGVVARLAARQVGPAGKVSGLDVNPGMLAVARSAAPRDLSIEWHEASAGAMPVTDASFDVVLCQMGLQFMPDRAAVLREMRRVLVPGGRLILNMPGPVPQMFAILGQSLAKHVGAEAGGFVNAVFSLHDEDEIQNLISGAGFHDVSVRSAEMSLRLPSPEEFMWQYILSTPLAGTMAQVDDGRRNALERDVVAGWQAFVKDEGLVLEVRNVTAAAVK